MQHAKRAGLRHDAITNALRQAMANTGSGLVEFEFAHHRNTELALSVRTGYVLVKAFEPYIRRLDQMIQSSFDGEASDRAVQTALNGEAGAELRRLVKVETLREHGAFFTGEKLARFALGPLLGCLSDDVVIHDPAVGAGDLLLRCAAALPTRRTLKSRLRLWECVLSGSDVNEYFVDACRRRLLLAAREATPSASRSWYDPADLFANIVAEDGLAQDEAIKRATHIVVNPPFTRVDAPDNCEWASGIVNHAALFVERCVRDASRDTRLIAILPEVLRTGERYELWRRVIESRCRYRRVASYGLFDQWADVDVFVLDVDVTGNCEKKPQWKWGRPVDGLSARLADKFRISVGSVVDFRDEELGNWFPYLTVENVPPWENVREVRKRRRFRGRAVKPPFVVVRRTSRPNDRFRAVGSVIRGKRPVVVDNHLLICEPRDRTVRTCNSLLERLKRSETSDWFNQRIRCRHLTVSAMKELPWWD